jgi:hypothetical protein
LLWVFFIAIYQLISNITDETVARIEALDAAERRASAPFPAVARPQDRKVFVAPGSASHRAEDLGFNRCSMLAGRDRGSRWPGAQKTIENLFGGVSVISDGTVRVGDFCKVADQVGTVEDIGLRATRIRTNARTVVSIPNGAIVTANLENFTARDKFLTNPVLSLRYETSADQLCCPTRPGNCCASTPG